MYVCMYVCISICIYVYIYMKMCRSWARQHQDVRLFKDEIGRHWWKRGWGRRRAFNSPRYPFLPQEAASYASSFLPLLPLQHVLHTPFYADCVCGCGPDKGVYSHILCVL